MGKQSDTIMPRRRRWPVVLGIVLLLVIWLGFQVVKIMFGIVDPSVDYKAEITQLVGSYQPKSGENGWPAFSESLVLFSDVGRANVESVIARAVSDTERDAMCRDYSRVLHGPPDRSRWTIEIDELRQLEERGVFDLVTQAAGQDRAIGEPPVPDPDFGNTIAFGLFNYEPGQASKLAAALTCRMRMAALDGRWKEHRQFFDEALACSKMIAVQGTAVEFRVALRSVVSPIDELQFELIEGLIDRESFVDLELTLAQRTQWLMEYGLVIEVERLAMLDAVQQWYTNNVLGIGFVVPSRVPGMSSSSISGMAELSPVDEPTLVDRVGNLRALGMPSRRDTIADIERWTRAWLAVGELEPDQWLARAAVVDDECMARFEANKVFGVIVIGGHSRVLGETLTVLQRMRVVRLMLAIERYRFENDGEYPGSLDALDTLAESGTRIDPHTGGPFVYRRVDVRIDERTGDDRPYLLFASGSDQDAPAGDALNGLRPD